MAVFHPNEDLLWAYAAGTQDEAAAVLVATHLALCPRCRAAVADMEAVGGELMEQVEAAPVSPQARDALMARLDAPVPAPARVRPAAPSPRTVLPRPLRDYVAGDADALPWRRLAGGIDAVDVPTGEEAQAQLLRIAPGTRLPRHGHGGREITLVLAGGFTDETGSYARGDVADAEPGLVHQPVADPGEACIALAVTRGPLVFSGLHALLARLLHLLGR